MDQYICMETGLFSRHMAGQINSCLLYTSTITQLISVFAIYIAGAIKKLGV